MAFAAKGTMGGSAKSSPPPAVAPPPIFVADKLFGEFSLGRINPPTNDTKIGSPSKSIDRSFQPSAPPFECIGRSPPQQPPPPPAAAPSVQAAPAVVAPIFGLDDIFGGLPGIRSKSSAIDDVFVMASSSNGTGTGGGGISSRSHQRSASCTAFPTLRDQSPGISPMSDSATGEASSSWSGSEKHQHQYQGATTTPNSPSKNNARGPNPVAAVVGGPGLSRFGAAAELTEAREKDASSEKVPLGKPGDAAAERQSSKNPPATTAATTTAAAAATVVPPPSTSPMGSAEATSSPSHSSKVRNNRVSSSSASSASSASANSSPRGGSPMAAATASLAPKFHPQTDEFHHHGSTAAGSTTGTSSSSPRRSKRQSATERLKAVLFPDSNKREDKATKNNNAKGNWLTVDELRLVTQPTDVPPPSRAPPETIRQPKKRDDRWRRKSCEFPSGGVPPTEPWEQSREEDAAAAGVSTSAAAMKEAVERAEAKIREKQKSGELGKADNGVSNADVGATKVGTSTASRERRHQEGDVEFDSRAMERAAHELREKALRKAAERATGIKIGTSEGDASRSASAPKHRVTTDQTELNSKKMFFSGEQCRPDPHAQAGATPLSTAATATATVASTSTEDSASSLEDLKRQRRDSSERSKEERAAKALAEKNLRELSARQEVEERQRVSATVETRVRFWANGKDGNLRALLVSLQDVLLPGSGWQPVSMSELQTEASVKKVYRKATLCLHPDKLQQRGASVQEKLIADRVFDLLKGAWNRFNSQESFFLQTA